MQTPEKNLDLYLFIGDKGINLWVDYLKPRPQYCSWLHVALISHLILLKYSAHDQTQHGTEATAPKSATIAVTRLACINDRVISINQSSV